MNEEIKKTVEAVTKHYTDQGQLIEAGWQALVLLSLKGCSEIQLAEMRKAYFHGAQHLWGSIFSFLEPGSEETPNDMRRMSLIESELQTFIAHEVMQENKGVLSKLAD